jgi:hypothetical protein
MARTSAETAEKGSLSDTASRLFASNATLLIGAAFEIGMLLGQQTGKTAIGKKVRASVGDLADRAVELAPDIVRLVPDLMPAKPRARRKAAKK